MKMMKKILPLLLVVALAVTAVTAFAVMSAAASDETNVTISVDKTNASVGDTITVKLGIKEMNASSLALGFYFDNTILEVTSVTAKRNVKLYYHDYDPDAGEWFNDELACTSVSTKAEANESGYVGVVWANDHEVLYYEKEATVTVKFTVKAPGTVEFLLKEDSAGTDGYKGDLMESGKTVTIAAACDHQGKTYTYESNGDGTHKVKCECGEYVSQDATCSGGNATCTTKAVCQHCGASYGALESHSFTNKASANQATPADCTNPATYYVQCDNCTEVHATMTVAVGEANGHSFLEGYRGEQLTTGDCGTPATYAGKCDHCDHQDATKVVTGEKNPAVHASETVNYTNNGATHSATYACCGAAYVTNEEHNFDNDAHTCVCGEVEKFKLTLVYINENGIPADLAFMVPFGAKISELSQVLALPSEIIINNTHMADAGDFYYTYNGVFQLSGWACGIEDDMAGITYEEYAALTMPAMDYVLDVEYAFTGWEYSYEAGWQYLIDHVNQTGWVKIENHWYYFAYDEENSTAFRAEGLSRVPYPKENGLTYAPNAEALAYCENKGMTFVDAAQAWFLFDAEGKFLATETLIYTDGNVTMYIENGMGIWHPGMVFDGEHYYYFTGDMVNGGNKLASGDVYVKYNCTDREFVIDGIYTFDANGVLIENNGVVDGRYYVNAQLMIGAGLVDYEGCQIYVRSDGTLATEGVYYATIGGVNYKFNVDANGFVTVKQGIVDGKFYINGSTAYGAGLIEFNGGYIYVRSNGEVVMDKGYWITNVNDTGIRVGFYKFDANGMLIMPEEYDYNGIVEVDGVLYYYEDGHIAYGAGLIEYNSQYIYVRSDGTLAIGKYWVTNTNGLCAPGYIEFGEDGYKLGQ